LVQARPFLAPVVRLVLLLEVAILVVEAQWFFPLATQQRITTLVAC
jgi:hypothetical protein